MLRGDRAIVPSGHRAIGRTRESGHRVNGPSCHRKAKGDRVTAIQTFESPRFASVCRIFREPSFGKPQRLRAVLWLRCIVTGRDREKRSRLPSALQAKTRFRPLLRQQYRVLRRILCEIGLVARLGSWQRPTLRNGAIASPTLGQRADSAMIGIVLHCGLRTSLYGFLALQESRPDPKIAGHWLQLEIAMKFGCFPKWPDGSLTRWPDYLFSRAASCLSFSVVCS
jgi:hypothetical protein